MMNVDRRPLAEASGECGHTDFSDVYVPQRADSCEITTTRVKKLPLGYFSFVIRYSFEHGQTRMKQRAVMW